MRDRRTPTKPSCNYGCLGESSTWSFSRKALMMIRNHLDEPPLPEYVINEESRAYNLTWSPSGFDETASFTNLPSVDYAKYLLSGVRFHLGQLYHLYDEDEFMRHFDQFYQLPTDRRLEEARENKTWYIQFLVLLALGKAIMSPPMKDSNKLPDSQSNATLHIRVQLAAITAKIINSMPTHNELFI
ncbi:hypothetical protein QQX98_000482 [Neonectria punicea]|uniref:Uncharacterized protein n=1 Tax=Neonectria punicea TaxID=979145 RepID=A0ABR1HUL4_9HYPO